MEEKNETFTYAYSAKQQEEVNRIRQKYSPKEENKMEQLYKLDRKVEAPGKIVALAVGIIGALGLGVGMCCTMLWAETLFIPGIIIGVIGMVGIALAYPLSLRITKQQREKMAPQILRLSDEVMHGMRSNA